MPYRYRASFRAFVLALAFCSVVARHAGAQTDHVSRVQAAYSGLNYDAEIGAGKTGTGRFLANRTVYLTDPSPYDGSASSPAVNAKTWAALYDQIARGANGAPSSDVIASRATARITSGQIPLSVLYWNYDYIVPESFDDARIAVNDDGFYRPTNPDGSLVNPNSPYGTRTLFTSGVMPGPSGSVAPQVTFVVPSDLVVMAPEASLGSI